MRKVLVISSNRLGDCILSSGLNYFFKKKSKDYNLVFVCGPIPGEFFKHCKNIDKIIIMKKKKFSLHWLFLWKNVIFNYWDYVIDLRGSAISFFLFSKNRKIFKSRSHTHKVIEISKLLSKTNISPNINFDKKITLKKKYLNIMRQQSKKRIVISPSSNWIGKTWSVENFSLLLEKLNKTSSFRNFCFVIVGPEGERHSIEKLLVKKKLPLIDLVGKINLAEIFLLMRESQLFIGNDSGLMHLSALANIPTIGLFGPSDPKKYHPWGERTLAIRSPKTPDELMGYKNFNSKNVNSLMGDLTVKVVYEEIIKFWKKIR